MYNNHNGKRNGWKFTNNSVKSGIKKNNHIKNIRKKLMEQKLKKRLSK
jgi:hypothetical protein